MLLAFPNPIPVELLKMVEIQTSEPSKKSRIDENRENFSSNVSSTEVVIASDVWKELPEDLFQAVLAKLPIATIFRFRSLSRKWNSVLSSNSFSRYFAEVQRGRRHPWFYIATHGKMMIYDPCLEKWYNYNSSSLPKLTYGVSIASAGGLVCFMHPKHGNIYVSNPLTHSFKHVSLTQSFKQSLLLPTLDWTEPTLGMALSNKGYKILCLESDGGYYEVYDSISNSWTRRGNMPASVTLPLSLYPKHAAIENTMYFLRWSPSGIVSYDLVSDVWQQFLISLPRHVRDYFLAEGQGKLMLVGWLPRDIDSSCVCLCVWELQKNTASWMEVDRMPYTMCMELYGKNVSMKCLGNRDLLVVALMSSKDKWRLVSYDVASKEWHMVPDCRFVDGRTLKHWMVEGTPFNPCMIVSP